MRHPDDMRCLRQSLIAAIASIPGPLSGLTDNAMHQTACGFILALEWVLNEPASAQPHTEAACESIFVWARNTLVQRRAMPNN